MGCDNSALPLSSQLDSHRPHSDYLAPKESTPASVRSSFLRFQPGKAEVMLHRQADDVAELQARMWASEGKSSPGKHKQGRTESRVEDKVQETH